MHFNEKMFQGALPQCLIHFHLSQPDWVALAGDLDLVLEVGI